MSIMESHQQNKSRHNDNVFREISYQIRTRAPFTPQPNDVLCNLMICLGEYAQKYNSYENAFLAYGNALAATKDYRLLRKAEDKIRELNKKRREVMTDIELHSMFVRFIEFSELNPRLLLLGISEISDSLAKGDSTRIALLEEIDRLKLENDTLKVNSKARYIQQVEKKVDLKAILTWSLLGGVVLLILIYLVVKKQQMK